MDIVNIVINFEDTFSGAKNVKETTVSLPTFNKMVKNDIGKIVSIFDKKQQIAFNWQITSILQA